MGAALGVGLMGAAFVVLRLGIISLLSHNFRLTGLEEGRECSGYGYGYGYGYGVRIRLRIEAGTRGGGGGDFWDCARTVLVENFFSNSP